MVPNKIDRKYYVWIWIALIVASFVRNIYDIYSTIAVLTSSTEKITSAISIFRLVILDGPLPAAITFLCTLAVWSIGASRFVRSVSRNDFCYLAMAFAAASKFIVGIIETFAILNDNLLYFTGNLIQPFMINLAMMLMFFLVIARKFGLNPVEKYNAFSVWSTVFFVAEGIIFAMRGGLVALLDTGLSNPEFAEILEEYGYVLAIDKMEIAAIIAGVCVYVAYVIAAIVLGSLLKKQSNLFRNPETRDYYNANHQNPGYNMRNDDSGYEDVFSDDQGAPKDDEKKDNVFDEFDL